MFSRDFSNIMNGLWCLLSQNQNVFEVVDYFKAWYELLDLVFGESVFFSLHCSNACHQCTVKAIRISKIQPDSECLLLYIFQGKEV